MPRVQVNSASLQPPAVPQASYEAIILKVDYPFVAPWDDGTGEPDTGTDWHVQITEDGAQKGRRVNQFATTTEGKNFSTRYGKFCKGIGVDPDDWETELVEGMEVMVEISTYESKGVTRNGIQSLLKR